MAELHDLLERRASGYEPSRDLFERVLDRRDHRQRNRRVAAGVFGIAVFALAAIGFVRLLGSEQGAMIGPAVPPSPTAAPRPSPAPGFSTFSSALHGITIDYPSGWKVRPATDPWNHGTVTFEASNVDVIFDPTLRDDLYLAMVSEPIGAKSATDWVQNLMPPSVGICTRAVGSGGGRNTLDLDGAVDGWIESCGTHVGSDNVMIVATATRGYIINVHVGDANAERRLQATYDGDWLDGVGDTIRERISAVLKTVELRPDDALDP